MKKENLWTKAMIVILVLGCAYHRALIGDLERTVKTYEKQQQQLIDRDRALQKELQDLKRYVQTGEASGG